MTAHEIIAQLGLHPHDEGGYYRQIYQAPWTFQTTHRDPPMRVSFSTIFYLLTAWDPIGHLHVNASDIIHCFHAGSPLTYLVISPDGHLERRVLGPDIHAGQTLHLIVPGGYWKATILEWGEYGLLSEVAIPAFEFRERTLATPDMIRQRFPHLWSQLAPYIRTPPA
ncbi:MAG: cupin domain-containing protein [Nitrospirae bacterium]|nr:MAG: cupin domain-containing protein [Nitrospirota bacterium]